MRTGLTLSPSPLRVFDRAVLVLRCDPLRPLLSLLLFFLLPYLAGFFLIYKPLVDGSQAYGTGSSDAYMIRYYSFIAWYFLLRGLNFVTTGRLIHARLNDTPLTFVHVVREAPALLLRGLLVYLPLVVLAYIGQYLGVVPGICVAFVACFYLPGFMLDRMGLKAAAVDTLRLWRGRLVILAIDFALLAGFVMFSQWGIGQINSRYSQDLSFSAASIVLCVLYAAVELIQTAYRLSLYACARDAAKPADDVAQVFD